LGYQPGLDGLRGLAVAAVLAFHSGFGWAGGGFLGVSAFFTLSGFLITTLLLTEAAATGRIGLRAFWARRFRRLLPAALMALGGIVLFGAFVADADQLRALRGDVLAALGDVANWWFVFTGDSYAELFTLPSPVQHFWSLAIEEQFYLTFPVLVVGVLALRRGRRPALLAVLGALAVASCALSFVLRDPGTDVERVYYGTDTRAVELLAGALLAVVAFGPLRPLNADGRHGDHLRSKVRRWGAPLTAWAGAAALVTMIAVWMTAAQTDEWLYRGGFTLHAALAVLVIAAAVRPGPVRSLLAFEPLRRLGIISYGVYLYHWPVFLWLSPERTGTDGWPLFALRAAVTFVLADLSYRFVEAPIRSGRRMRGALPWLAMPAAFATLGLALVIVTANLPTPEVVLSATIKPPPAPLPSSTVAARVPPDSAVAPTTARPEAVTTSPASLASPTSRARRTTTVPATAPPTSAPPPPPVKIMVVGDSVSASLGAGLEEWAGITGRAQVWNVATRWCGIGRGGDIPFSPSSARTECDRWAERWAQQLDTFDPDVVVVLSTTWDLVAHKLPEWDGFKEPGDPDYDAWLRSEYAVAADLLASRGAGVAWLTTPCLHGQSADDGRVAALNDGVIRPVAAGRPFVRVIDLFAKLCPNGTFVERIDGIVIRPDKAHFSTRSALWVSEWLGPQLVSPR
jgi:peptidoglycan/LPS O-acetylase OafA/YrhL